MVFSDIEQDIGGHHVYGALEDVSDKYKYSHRDFDFYRRLVDLFAKGQDLSLLADTKQATGNGWDLDKWKFVPIARRVYVERPDIKWYIFLEADAYMGWTNLLELLSKFDPDKPWYLGATHFYGDVAFAHGGMGYIISNGAMRMLDTIWSPQNIARWERRTAAGCCGDVELAAVLQEAGVNITGIPGLYGESLSWFEWDEGKWCEPALSWHHVRAHDVESLWQFESQWLTDNETHYVYRDLFHKLVKSHLASTRSDWDNMSRDRVYTGPSGLHGDEDRRYPLKITWGNLSDEEKVEQLGQLDDDLKKDIESYGTYVKEMRWDELSDEEKDAVWRELTEPESEAHSSLRTCRVACESWEAYPVDEDVNVGMDGTNRTSSGWMEARIDAFEGRMSECKTVPEWMSHYAETELL
ncbi:hypothetical protein LTR56_025922 [Elasticomyces elasticus]|nr:hypothetical protein LTR56_025922 [Elasticomyces elasticus]KAK3618307.1 hypothetical protein LTR22_026417 [Elasticomyces elasticus]KAK5737078.1 hypothetical protein LTS12_025996 [Elasticomyces elasticus]